MELVKDKGLIANGKSHNVTQGCGTFSGLRIKLESHTSVMLNELYLAQGLNSTLVAAMLGNALGEVLPTTGREI